MSPSKATLDEATGIKQAASSGQPVKVANVKRHDQVYAEDRDNDKNLMGPTVCVHV
jgi:hypothetical protein